MRPFSEGQVSPVDYPGDQYFSNGSDASVGEEPGSFSEGLGSKSIIRISLPIRNPVQMCPASSSVYYFDRVAQQWKIPHSATSDITGHLDKKQYYYNKTIVAESTKGFDSFGSCATSGSISIVTGQTNSLLGTQLPDRETLISYMDADYPSSISRSSTYDALDTETFGLSIDQPFLLEKAVFQIPFCFGETWFQDSTVASFSFATGSIQVGPNKVDSANFVDKGGPTLTFALYCQKNYGTSSIRDLIMTGTITHVSDSLTRITARDDSKIPDYLWDPNVVLNGDYVGLSWFEKYGNDTAGSYIIDSPSSKGRYFTGSVMLKCESQVSNGVNACMGNLETIGPVGPGSKAVSIGDIVKKYTSIFSQENMSFDNVSKGFVTFVTSIDPFGRGMTGFSPSGGSIFGREYSTPQRQGVIKNPLYISDATQRDATIQSITDSYTHALTKKPGLSYVKMLFLAPCRAFSTTVPSPYLLMPSDKLLLTISKTYPASAIANFSFSDSANYAGGDGTLIAETKLSGSIYGHDVTLNSGVLDMTFFGSYVQRGNRYKP